jgi:nicotinamidase-related amidase
LLGVQTDNKAGVASAEFEPGDALLVVDVLNDFEHDDGEALLESFRERAPRMREALKRARDSGVPVVYVNDDRAHWDSDAPGLVREALAGRGGDVIAPLAPRDGDRILLKHRYSAFDHTALDLLLPSLQVERVLLIGAATEGCVVQTAIDAREHGLKATIIAGACATASAELEATALRYAADVGGVRVA